MNWILEHFQLVVVIAGALAAWMNQRKKGGPIEGDEEEGGTPPSDVTGADDQTRRIQEEIRRKIAERRGQSAPVAPAEPPTESWHQPAPPVLAPRPVAEGMPAPLRDLLSRRIEETRRREEAAASARARVEQQRVRQQEQEEAAALARETELQRRQAISRQEAATALAAATQVRSAWLRQLRDPSQVRQAIILREIVGPPVGLQ